MAGSNERQRIVCAERALDEHLDPAAGPLAAREPRFDHPRVIQHHRVAFADLRRQLGEGEILDLAAARIEMQQPACSALGRGALRDQLLGQRIVELGDEHARGL